MTEDFEVMTRSEAQRRRDAERDAARWKSEAYRVSDELIAAQQAIAKLEERLEAAWTRGDEDAVRLITYAATERELRADMERHHEPGLCCSVCNIHVNPHRRCFLR